MDIRKGEGVNTMGNNSLKYKEKSDLAPFLQIWSENLSENKPPLSLDHVKTL